MAQKLYVWVAVGGIALASAGAWWFQNRPASEAQQAAMGTNEGALPYARAASLENR